MRSDYEEFKARALSRPDVRREFDKLEEEFALLGEFLRARGESGLSQAEVAKRTGTSQSAIARLESPGGKHSPSLATLRRYAGALGYQVQIRLVKKKNAGQKASPCKSKKKASPERNSSVRHPIAKG